MSANNFIEIKWKKATYRVCHRDADTGYLLEEIGCAKTLEKAVKIANHFILNNIVEYGLQIIPRV
jgi:hypothetical protein